MTQKQWIPAWGLFLVSSTWIGLTTIPSAAKDSSPRIATTDIVGCNNKTIRGTGTLIQKTSDEGIKEVCVSVGIWGLSDGKPAVHIHETVKGEPCRAAWDRPEPNPNGTIDPEAPRFQPPFHRRDRGNLDGNDGRSVRQILTNRVTLSPGRLSLFDEDRSSFIIHTFENTCCDLEGESELGKGCAGEP